jgi:hypothetical protein
MQIVLEILNLLRANRFLFISLSPFNPLPLPNLGIRFWGAGHPAGQSMISRLENDVLGNEGRLAAGYLQTNPLPTH